MTTEAVPEGTFEATANLLPEGAMPTHAFRAVFYLDDEGVECYGFAHEGSAVLSQWLGSLELLKEDMIAEFRGKRNDVNDDD